MRRFGYIFVLFSIFSCAAHAAFKTDYATVTVSIQIPHSDTPPSGDCDSDDEKGRIYQDTDGTTGQQIYACEGTSGWVLQGGGGGGGGGGGSFAVAVSSVIVAPTVSTMNFSGSDMAISVTGSTAHVHVNIPGILNRSTITALGSVIDISANTNLTASGPLTLTGDNLTLSNTFYITNASVSESRTLSISSGTIPTLITSSSITIPSGAAVVVSSSGHIAIDTTDDQIIFSTSAWAIPSHQAFHLPVTSPLAGTYIWGQAVDGITVRSIRCGVQDGTNMVGQIQECTGRTTDTCSDLDADITCTTAGGTDDGTFTDNLIAAGNFMAVKITSVSGAVTHGFFTIDKTVVRE